MQTLAGANTGAATVANVHLATSRLLPSCEISLTASNVFDTRYGAPGAEDHVQDELAQPGRLLLLKVTRRF